MWNICPLLFINLKIWGICIAFTYYHEQIRIGRNNVCALQWYHIKEIWAKLSWKGSQSWGLCCLDAFVLTLCKHSHTAPQGEVNAIPHFHQSKTWAQPFTCMRKWSHSNRCIIVCIRQSCAWALDMRRPHLVTSKVPASSWWPILDVVPLCSQV